jgi:acetylornithine/succinyldiaminopimelate/putrescine aminotransferase
LPAGYVAVPRSSPETLREAVGERTAAVMIEPIQGEAGVFVIDDEVLVAAREATEAAGALLVFDEIQSGMGRTGSLWAYEQLPVSPDVMTAAKALGGGLPVGACLTTPELGDVLERGDHGSTFGGAPIAAAAALAAFDVIDDPELLRRTRELGARFARRLAGLDAVHEVRGRGLMVGLTLDGDGDAGEVAGRALAEGLVINVPGPGMLRFLPPLTVGPEEVDRAGAIMADVLG